MGRAPRWRAAIAACLLALACCPLSGASAGCHTGDAACACKAIGGAWLTSPSVVRPTCRRTWGPQQRLVDVYFPSDIGSRHGIKYRVWMHLHGAHWAQWFLDAFPAWQQLRGSFPIPLGGNADTYRSGLITGSMMTSAAGSPGSSYSSVAGTIVVVPHCCADAVESGQLWNTGFWPCFSNMNKCADASVDDTGFIASVIRGLPQLLPDVPLASAAPFVSGYSNGGMILQALLCKQPSIVESLSGIALIATILGTDFARSQCQASLPKAVPLLWVHGTQDRTLPFGEGKESQGVQVLGAEGGVKFWAGRMSCPASAIASPRTIYSDAAKGLVCKDFCPAGRPGAVLCSLAGVDHAVWEQPGHGVTQGLSLWASNGFAGKPAPV